jgi:hypothetical protein
MIQHRSCAVETGSETSCTVRAEGQRIMLQGHYATAIEDALGSVRPQWTEQPISTHRAGKRARVRLAPVAAESEKYLTIDVLPYAHSTKFARFIPK